MDWTPHSGLLLTPWPCAPTHSWLLRKARCSYFFTGWDQKKIWRERFQVPPKLNSHAQRYPETLEAVSSGSVKSPFWEIFRQGCEKILGRSFKFSHSTRGWRAEPNSSTVPRLSCWSVWNDYLWAEFWFPFLVQLALNLMLLTHCLMCIPLWQLVCSQKEAKIINS